MIRLDTAAITVPVDEIPDLLIPAFVDTVLMVTIVMAVVLVVGVPLGALVLDTPQVEVAA